MDSETTFRYRRRLVEGTETNFPFLDEVELIQANLFGADFFWGFIGVPEEIFDVVGVSVDGTLGHVSDEHVFGHSFGDGRESSFLIGGQEQNLSMRV